MGGTEDAFFGTRDLEIVYRYSKSRDQIPLWTHKRRFSAGIRNHAIPYVGSPGKNYLIRMDFFDTETTALRVVIINYPKLRYTPMPFYAFSPFLLQHNDLDVCYILRITWR
jgi:hypothetical protein